jgi:hypothetical protein
VGIAAGLAFIGVLLAVGGGFAGGGPQGSGGTVTRADASGAEGKAGPGKWVTIYANAGHVYLVVAGIRFDTSAAKVTGSRWENDLRDNVGFVARHPAGL